MIRMPRPDSEASLGELVSGMTADLSVLIHKEIDLAKLELKEQVQRSARAGGMLGGAGFAGYMALILLSFAAAWALAVAIPIWAGFLIMGGLYAVGAAALLLRGRREMKAVHPVPEQTIDTLKEDVQWAKTLHS